jgi:hypothetical protein
VSGWGSVLVQGKYREEKGCDNNDNNNDDANNNNNNKQWYRGKTRQRILV